MMYPRVTAAIFVALLIGCLGLAGVLGVALVGPALAHGTNYEHASGIIVDIGPGRNFVLRTASGKQMSFQCKAQCRGSLRHLQRHLKELANTDVYYRRGPDNTLLVIDVD